MRSATPRWVLLASAGLGWLAAASTAVLFVLVGSLVSAATPAVLGPDSVLSSTVRPGWYASVIALAVLSAACAGAGAWFSQWASSEAERRLRAHVVSAVFRSGAVHASAQAGRLLSTAGSAVEKAAQYRASFLGPITASLTTPLLVLAIMAVAVDWVTAGALAVLILMVPLLVGGFQRLVRPVGGQYRRSQARLTAAFLDAIQALETLVHARAAERWGETLAQQGEAHRSSLMRLLAANQLLILVVDAAFSLAVVVAAALLSVTRVSTGEMSLGEAVAVVLMSTLVIGPVDVVGQFFYIGIAGRASQAQIGTLLAGADGAAGAMGAVDVDGAADMPDGIASAASRAAPAGPPGRGALVLDSVTAGWPGGPAVLEDLSLTVNPGERVALVGPSGAGKSTAAALLQGHILPRAGRVAVDGVEWGSAASAADLAQARSRMAVVEQRAFLFLGSIRDNLLIAVPTTGGGTGTGAVAGSDGERSGTGDEALWIALDRAGLRPDVEAMPAGLDTEVGEQGSLLSGGQVQRLAIARAWLSEAPILILDEPTSQVDLAAESAVLAALNSLAGARTVLMIAHRPGAVLSADRVVRLEPVR